MPSGRFDSFESSFDVLPDIIDEILQDKLAFAIFRRAVAPGLCAEIASRFRQSPIARGRNDNVPGRVLGTFHYLKQPAVYLAESLNAIQELDQFFSQLENPMMAAFDQFTKYLSPRGIQLRQGQLSGSPFCPLIIRSWDGHGEYQLRPHDDTAQLSYPPQKDFEFTKVAPTVGAVNICLENATNSGSLRVWNSRPDRDERHRLDIQFSGYPYPQNVLDKFQYLEVPIFAGDLYVINGRYVHAVVGGAQFSPRTTMASMLGYIDAQTAIYWS
jgi:hypothetical protein